jgi:predicted AAA+ superfamily ATPase
MYPLDFEEFLWANGVSEEAISAMKQKFDNREALNESLHTHILNLWKRYLLVGGLPEVVNKYLETTNIVVVRKTQSDIHAMYGIDASKYDVEHKLKIRRIYDLIPSNMENKKKRVVIQSIENKKGKRTSDYVDEFDFLINSGIALEVKAISNPKFPLIESAGKNLLKLYLNDVGLLTNLLYRNNINAILGDERSVNLGSVYESVVAQELRTHDNNLFYYDNKVRGEVDFLIDDYDLLSVVPIEVKSGKDYTVHSALNLFVSNDEYSIKQGIVLSNERDVFADGKIIYMPIYYVMFLQHKKVDFIKI